MKRIKTGSALRSRTTCVETLACDPEGSNRAVIVSGPVSVVFSSTSAPPVSVKVITSTGDASPWMSVAVAVTAVTPVVQRMPMVNRVGVPVIVIAE